MNEISKTDGVSQSNWQDEHQNFSESGKRNPYMETEKAVAAKERSGGDIASILGISPGAINAEIKDAVSSLLDQLDFLRKQTQQAVARSNFLEKQVDSDSIFSVMNRAAFIREFSRRIEHSKNVGFKCSVGVFFCDDFYHWRKSDGLKKSFQRFSVIIDTFQDIKKASEVVGFLGGATIGVVMPLLANIDAQERAFQIMSRLNEKFISEGHKFDCSFHFGTYEVNDRDTAETALDSADQKLIFKLR
ncbi:MAG: diguanylate cyclase [Alphaproteobacteria bacterium]